MKRSVLILAILLLVGSVFAAHTTTVSVNPTSSYETLSKNYAITISNDLSSSNPINNVTIYFNGFNFNAVYYNPAGWNYLNNINSITFYGGSISPWGSQNFGLNLTANLVNLNTTYNWTIMKKNFANQFLK